VGTIALDDFAREHPELRPALVKIDVEGHEAAVLRGMAGTLRDCAPAVICELHGTASTVLEELEAAGYEARLLDARGPVLRAPRGAHLLAAPSGRGG
jgi:hypothetical protein